MEDVEQHVVAQLDHILTQRAKNTVAAGVVAQAVNHLGIKVSSSRHIGVHFNDNDIKEFTHERCVSTKAEGQWDKEVTITENVREICGDSAVVLKYEYGLPCFPSSAPGQIRLLLRSQHGEGGSRYLKHYAGGGTIAFRFDSVLSHLGIMHGACPESPHGLQPGQFLPAFHTDEAVKGGLYFYGSLNACPLSGPGKWKPCNLETLNLQLRALNK